MLTYLLIQTNYKTIGSGGSQTENARLPSNISTDSRDLHPIMSSFPSQYSNRLVFLWRGLVPGSTGNVPNS